MAKPDKPVALPDQLNDKPDNRNADETNARLNDAVFLARQDPKEVRKNNEISGQIDDLIKKYPKTDDKNAGWLERSKIVTPADTKDGVKYSVIAHFPPDPMHPKDRVLKMGFDAKGEQIKFGDHYIKKDGVWGYNNKEGKFVKTPFQNYKFDKKSGEFLSQDTANHIQVHKLSGGPDSEINIMANGAKVRNEAEWAVIKMRDGTITRTDIIKWNVGRIERTNGSVVEPKYQLDAVGNKTTLDSFTISKPAGKDAQVQQMEYTRADGKFVPTADHPDAPTYDDVSIATNGNLHCKSGDKEFVTSSSGVILSGEGKTQYDFDGLGRIISLTPSVEAINNGAMIRSGIEYEGNTNKIIKITGENPKKYPGKLFMSVLDAKGKWTCTDNNGANIPLKQVQPYFNQVGEYAYKEVFGQGKNRVEVDTVTHPDGKVERQKVSSLPDGSISTRLYDEHGKYNGIRIAKDGKMITSLSYAVNKEGKPQITETDHLSNTTIWSKEKTGEWTADKANLEPRYALTFYNDGGIRYLDKQGAIHSQQLDKTERIKFADQSYRDLDADGRVVKEGINSKNYLSYEYVRNEKGESKLTQVNRVFQGEAAEKIWDAESGRKGKIVDKGFQYEDENKKLILERRDLRTIIHSKNNPDRLEEVRLPSGEVRKFEYGRGRDAECNRIISTYPHGNGQVTSILEATEIGGAGMRTRVPMQVYDRTSVIEFNERGAAVTREFPSNLPSRYIALKVREDGNIEATGFGDAKRYLLPMNDPKQKGKFVAPQSRSINAHQSFNQIVNTKISPLLSDGKDIDVQMSPARIAGNAARLYKQAKGTAAEVPLLAQWDSTRLPKLPTGRNNKSAQLEVATEVLKVQLRKVGE